jgi:hypothetical protein
VGEKSQVYSRTAFCQPTLSSGGHMPTRKVYWKGLRIVLIVVKSYIERNLAGLTNNLTGPQLACVMATLEAVITCLEALPDNTPA